MKERDRDKSRDKDIHKDKDELPDRPHSRQQLLAEAEKSKEGDEKEEKRERPRSLHRFNLSSQTRISREDVPMSAGLSSGQAEHFHHPQYGWSSMLEDWYVNGGKHLDPNPDSVLSKRPLLDVPIGDELSKPCEDVAVPPKSKSTGDLNARMDARTCYKGPYELLIKERMMGLYLAVFISRDIRGLVRGMLS